MLIQLNQKPQKGLPDLDEFFKKLAPSFRKKHKDPFQSKKGNVGWWGLVAVLLVIVLGVFSSMVTVKPGEALVVTRFGVYDKTDGPGLHFTIPLINERTLLNLDEAHSLTYRGQNLTDDDSLIDVSANVAYKVTDPKAYLFSGNVNAAVQNELSQAVTMVMLQSGFAELLNDENWKSVAGNIQNNLGSLSQFGIKVTGVEIQKVRVPSALAGDFNATIANAQNQVKQIIADANAFAADLKPLAAEKAARSIAFADAEKFAIMVSATRDEAEFNSLLPAYQSNHAATLAYLPLLLANSWRSVHAISSEGATRATPRANKSGQAAYLRWQTAFQNQKANQDEKN